jgi:hypothetical protein
VRHLHQHLLVKCVSRFHLSEFTTLQTRVPLVSMGHRGSPLLRFGSEIAVHYQWASHLEVCHASTHATSPSHRSPDGPVQATRSFVKGRTTHKWVWYLSGENGPCFGSLSPLFELSNSIHCYTNPVLNCSNTQ